MAKPSDKILEYERRANAMQWPEVEKLWAEVQKETTPDWDDGKALEYLVVRGFSLSGLSVEYPYDVPPGGKPLEQIDGIVYLRDLAFLIECKDKETADIEVIAKVLNQLSRRPPTTLACVFIAGRFTASALTIADMITPHRVTLWTMDDINAAVISNNFATPLEEKYKCLCRFGLSDHSPNYKDLEV